MSIAKAKATVAEAAKPEAAATIQAAAAAAHDKAATFTKERVEATAKASNEALRGFEDVLQANKEYVEAILKAGTVVARGWQDVGSRLISLAQESAQDSVAASKAMAGAKSLKELVDLQSTLARGQFDKIVVEGGRLSEMSVKLAEEAFAPITARVNATVEKLVKPIA